MKSILYSKIIRTKVDTPNQRGKAKLVDVLALKDAGNWKAGEVMIESGLVNKKGRFFSVNEVRFDPEEEKLELTKSLNKGKKNPMGRHELFLSRLDGKKVVSSKGKDLGRVYDYELHLDLKPWKVWKILMDPTGLSPLKRRMKIPTKAVEKVEDKTIILKKGWKSKNR
ncbi:MAG: PRC-barrel domain-containing protein [Candidatus Thermoplasmatota archaeon]|nr:PRC-barrel domain-containing protein [Candidatus Thermoplasmatota archaeon]